MSNSLQWSDYDEWNDWIAEILFPEVEVATPVYLDVEDDVVARLSISAGIAADDVVPALLDVVRATLLSRGPSAFDRHHRRLAAWRAGTRVETNPLIALLSVFSLAAEKMASGDGMAAHNYYGRLGDLLAVRDSERLASSYRAVAEPFWASLNLWLESLGGRRGLPTAYSVGLRYVGLALSQALVREADRRNLERFFADFALAPRSELPPGELLPLIGSWVSQTPSPATNHLAKLWKKPALQERIAEVAATLLAEWDGAEQENANGAAHRGRVRLVLQLTSFPKRRARLSPLFFVADASRTRDSRLLGDTPVDVKLVPSMPGAATLADAGLIDAADLLEGVLTLEDATAGRLERRPRGLVVFRRDELSGAWIEVPQVLLGDDVVLLVADRLLAATTSLLDAVARAGWKLDKETPGIPQGWTLVRDVEVFGRPASPESLHLDVRALVPLTSSQLKLAGGFALPGALRHRWHTWRAPEIRAVSDSSGFTVRLVSLGAPGEDDEPLVLEEWSDNGTGSVIQALDGLDLEDGDYQVELVADGTVSARKSVVLRSSDNPDAIQWARVESIMHDISDPLAVMGADSGAGAVRLHGVELEYDAPIRRPSESSPPPAQPWWKPVRDKERQAKVALRRPEAESCFYTGAHYTIVEQVPIDSKTFRPKVASSAGVCKWCGLERRYPASYWRNKRDYDRRRGASTSDTVDVRALPPVVPVTEPSDDWSTAFDALQYTGGGHASLLARVAAQIDPSRVFYKEFVQTLDSLGHIELRRAATDLSEISWEVTSTAVVDTGADRVLTGYWPPVLRDIAAQNSEDHGHIYSVEQQRRGPDRVATTASDDALLQWLEIEDVAIAGDAAGALVDALPPLSTVIAALPRRHMNGWLETQWFDPARAAWVDGEGMDGVGAYRVGRFASEYFYRTHGDLDDGTAAIGDVYLVKHAAAADLANRPLIAWSRDSRELAVPLGASLPGLYQRAAVLCSGRAPERRRNYMVYMSVPERVASRLTYLLTN